LPYAPRLKNAERPKKKRPFASGAGRTLSSLPPSGVRRSFGQVGASRMGTIREKSRR
jgi:hypothetical protein